MWWMSWAIGGVLLLAMQFVEDESEKKEKVKEVLGDKGYIKYYDKNTKTFGIEMDTGNNFKDLEKLKDNIENVLKTEVEINNHNFNYTITPKREKNISEYISFKKVDTSDYRGFKLAIGESENGIEYIDFTFTPHTLVAGATGWGKSIFTRALLTQAILNDPTIELELFDFKTGIELRDFKNLKQTKSFTIRPHLAEDELTRIYDEIEARFDLLDEVDVRDIYEYNAIASALDRPKMTKKIVVLEEFTILLGEKKEITTILTKSLAIARAVGVYYVLTSQRFSADIIDGKIKNNIDNRICYHVADATNSKIILDDTGAERLKVKGRAIFSNGCNKTEVQTFYISPQTLREATRGFIEKKTINNTVKNKNATEGEKWLI